jgi:prepilin-type N-terminal cleavage/methylation domain-containing protein/prepilin-type processing-associated H-X9-DG protein
MTHPRKRVGFTLIELLVVIAIIAILAAILFPVFAQARAKARQATCLSNLKQVGIASMMYLQDFDEGFVPYQWQGTGSTLPCPPEWGGICTTFTPGWLYLLQPYSKNNLYSQCPDAKKNTRANATAERLWREGRVGYGLAYPVPGENFGGLAGSSASAAMESPADHILTLDVVPDGANGQGIYNPWGGYFNHATTPFGLPEYGATGTLNAANHMRPQGRHNGMVSVAFCDGHVKALNFNKVYPMREEVCTAGNGQGCSTTAITAASNPELWKLWK